MSILCRVLFRSTLFPLAAPLMLIAHPKGMHCTHGTAHSHHKSDHHLQITTSDRAIIQWDKFSIDSNEIAEFILPSSKSAVLNRVIGNEQSHLMGMLQANGQVFLINSNGILIGKDAMINTASFIASTFDVLDAEFLKNSDMTFSGTSTNPLINLGTIHAFDQDVILLAHRIQNDGTITAPNGTVSLGSGHEILLKMEGKEKIYIRPTQGTKSEEVGIENNGTISALTAELKADGNIYALAIKDSGTIEASGVAERNGRIYLVAEKNRVDTSGHLVAKNANATGGTIHLLGDEVIVRQGASIDVSGDLAGGEVLIGGDYQGNNPKIYNAKLSYIEEEAHINADSHIQGNGGKVIVWGDEATVYYGNITGRGGREGGDGGFAEISGKYLIFEGPVDLSAQKGKNGHLLLDPTNVEISTATQTPGMNLNAFPSATLVCASGDTIVNVSSLVSSLSRSPVTISTNSINCNSAVGNITVLSPINWTSANDLRLVATGSIDIDANATITSTNGSFELIADGDITTGSIDTNQGAIAFTAGGSITANNINYNQNQIRELISFAAGGNITVNNLTSRAADLRFTAGGNISVNNVLTNSISSNNIQSFQAAGNINISGLVDHRGKTDLRLIAGQNINVVGSNASIQSIFGTPPFPIGITAGGAVTLNNSGLTDAPTQIIGNNTVSITANSLALNPGNQPCTIQSTPNLILNIGTGGIWLNAETGPLASIIFPTPISLTGLNGTYGPLSLIGAASIFSTTPGDALL